MSLRDLKIEMSRALIARDVDAVRHLISAGVALDGPLEMYSDKHALHVAAENGFAEGCQLLIAAGAQVNAVNRKKRIAPLGHPDNKAHSNIRALHYAALAGSAETCKVLIAAGADIEARDSYGDTALAMAVEKGRVEVLKLLMANGAKLRGRDVDDVFYGAQSYAVMKQLLSGAARWARRAGGANFREVLQHHVKFGNVGPVRACLEAFDVDLAQKGKGGRSLVQLAGNHVEVKALLLAARSGDLVDSALVGEVASSGQVVVSRRAAGPAL
jgi:hypothetical protein